VFSILMASRPLQWHGGTVRAYVARQVEARLRAGGRAGVAAAAARLDDDRRAAAGVAWAYDPATYTLRIDAAAPWAAAVELGSAQAAAQPFLRPALTAAAERFSDG
jgi:hypothetical protein